jgi:hypothetical protein
MAKSVKQRERALRELGYTNVAAHDLLQVWIETAERENPAQAVESRGIQESLDATVPTLAPTLSRRRPRRRAA